MLSDESPLAEGICSVGLVCVSFHSTSKTTWECASIALLLKGTSWSKPSCTCCRATNPPRFAWDGGSAETGKAPGKPGWVARSTGLSSTNSYQVPELGLGPWWLTEAMWDSLGLCFVFILGSLSGMAFNSMEDTSCGSPSFDRCRNWSTERWSKRWGNGGRTVWTLGLITKFLINIFSFHSFNKLFEHGLRHSFSFRWST